MGTQKKPHPIRFWKLQRFQFFNLFFGDFPLFRDDHLPDFGLLALAGGPGGPGGTELCAPRVLWVPGSILSTGLAMWEAARGVPGPVEQVRPPRR